MPDSDKHFLNTPSTLVLDSLHGLCLANPLVKLDEANRVIYQSKIDQSKVALICGGGSGHEPAHAAFVGSGMLTAAISGNIFASPNPSQVRRGIELAENEKGTLIIVKNYTGDILNFGLAKETFAASHPDKIEHLKFLVVGDDVSVGRTQGSIVGRRGLAGTVLVYKIAGAHAQTGANLNEVYSVAQWVANRLGTVGVGLEHCHVPGTEPSKSHLTATEVEVGMGIHNEPGFSRLSPIPPLKDLARQLLSLITSTNDPERSFLPFKNDGSDEVVLLVNNLGGLSELELGGVTNAAFQATEGKVIIKRVIVGTFMTSLNMPGFSLTLLLLPHASDSNAPDTSLILSLLDAKTEAPGWKWSFAGAPGSSAQDATPSSTDSSVSTSSHTQVAAADPEKFVASIKRACNAIIAAEPKITEMDTIAGDGDCGLTLKAGAEAVLKGVDSGKISGGDIVGSILAIASVAEVQMGGTSGGLYTIFFSSLAQGLVSATSGGSSDAIHASPDIWISALKHAFERLYTYTRARPPSRTLVDPLAAFVQTITANGNFAHAVKAAGDAAESTKNLVAKAGRSAYVGSQHLKDQQIPDPGAWGIKVILEGLSSSS